MMVRRKGRLAAFPGLTANDGLLISTATETRTAITLEMRFRNPFESIDHRPVEA